MIRTALAAAAFFPLLLPSLRSQQEKDEGLTKTSLEDPYTGRDEKAMAALGVLSYGPLEWADQKRTTDIEKVLGEGRVLWLETEHFRIGTNLGFTKAPEDARARKILGEELKRLNRKLRKVPTSASKLDPWRRAHLYAQRAEELYADFAALAGKDEPGKCLGRDQKFLVLLFQKRSDLARYLDTFCGRKSEMSQRHHHPASGHYSIVLTAEGDDGPRECETVHAQFRFLLMQMFVDAAGGAPPWLAYGLAHLCEREVPCNLINCGVRPDESVDPATQYDWERKMVKRVEHEELLIPFAELCRATDLGYYGHVQSWSRVDFLRQERARFETFLRAVLGNTSRQRQIEALQTAYELEPEQFDAEWRKWAQKHYK